MIVIYTRTTLYYLMSKGVAAIEPKEEHILTKNEDYIKIEYL